MPWLAFAAPASFFQSTSSPICAAEKRSNQSVLASSSPFLLPFKFSLQKAILNMTCPRTADVMGVEMLG